MIAPLLTNIIPDHVSVSALSNGRHEKSIRPQLSAPKFSSQVRVSTKHFFRRYALDHSDNPRRRELWRSTQQVMDVILIDPDLLELHAISLFNFFAYIAEALLPVRTAEYRLPILHGCHKVIVDLIRIMLACPDLPHGLRILQGDPRGRAVAE